METWSHRGRNATAEIGVWTTEPTLGQGPGPSVRLTRFLDPVTEMGGDRTWSSFGPLSLPSEGVLEQLGPRLSTNYAAAPLSASLTGKSSGISTRSMVPLSRPETAQIRPL